jgi:hypothetical protein
MALDESPWVFRYDNKWFVSELPKAEAVAQLDAQRAWDTENARVNHWALAIGIGAAVGTILTFIGSWLLGAPPVLNLFLLPIGFAAGAVIGGKTNEGLRRTRPEDASLPPRPKAAPMTKVPRRVVANADSSLSAKEIIELSTAPKRT